MKNVIVGAALVMVGGCASVNQADYPNTVFHSGEVGHVEYERPAVSQDAPLGECVVSEVSQRVYVSDVSDELGAWLFESGDWSLEFEGHERVLELDVHVLEEGADVVRVRGQIPHTLDGLAPESLRYVLSVSSQLNRTVYRYDELERYFAMKSEALPQEYQNWFPIETRVPSSVMKHLHGLLKDQVNQIQACVETA